MLFGIGFWKRLINFDMLIEEGVIAPADLELFQFADTPEDAWEHLRRFYRL